MVNGDIDGGLDDQLEVAFGLGLQPGVSQKPLLSKRPDCAQV
jgi:hypothetical protein